MWMNVTSHQFAAEDHWQRTAVTWDQTTCLVVRGDPPPVSNVSKFTWNKNTKASTQSLLLIVRNVQLTKQSGRFVDRLPTKTRDKLIHSVQHDNQVSCIGYWTLGMSLYKCSGHLPQAVSPNWGGRGNVMSGARPRQPNWNFKERKTCSAPSYIILNYIVITFWWGRYWLITKS